MLTEGLTIHGEAPVVFVTPKGMAWTGSGLTSWLQRASKRAIKIIGSRVQRHTSAGRLVMSGVDIRTVPELRGDPEINMTMRYAHMSPDHKSGAMERPFSGKSPANFHSTPSGGD